MKGRPVKDGDGIPEPLLPAAISLPSMKGRPVKDGDHHPQCCAQDSTWGPSMKGRPVKDGDHHQAHEYVHTSPPLNERPSRKGRRLTLRSGTALHPVGPQ